MFFEGIQKPILNIILSIECKIKKRKPKNVEKKEQSWRNQLPEFKTNQSTIVLALRQTYRPMERIESPGTNFACTVK